MLRKMRSSQHWDNRVNLLMRKSAVPLPATNFRKVVTLTLIASNALLILLVAIVLTNTRQQMEDRASTAAHNLSSTLDLAVSGVIDRADMTISLSRDEIEQQLAGDGFLDKAGAARQLERVQAMLPGMTQVWISDAEGSLIHGAGLAENVSTMLARIAANSDFAPLKKDANAGLIVGQPLVLPPPASSSSTESLNPTSQLPFARRLNMPDGSYAGMVLGLLALDAFDLKLAAAKLSPGDAVELRDRDLNVILRHPALPGTGSTGITGITGITDKIDGTNSAKDKHLYQYRKLADYPLYISLDQDQNELLSPWRKGLFAAAAALIFFMLASLVVSRMLLRLWTRQNATIESLAASKQALLQGERRWRKIFDQSPMGAAVMTVDRQLINVNDSLCRILGYTREELLTKQFQHIAHPEELPRELAQMQQLLDGEIEQYSNECRYLSRDGNIVCTQVLMNLVRDAAGQPLYFMPMIEDIGTRKQAEAQINYLAFHDALTGLPNRQLAKDRLDHAVAYAAREKSGVGVLHLDLDHFKAINDSLGHPIGDALIKEMATKLQDCVRDTDTIARLGGDEFLIILSNVIDPEIISSIAVKVQETLGSTFKVQGHELTTSVSIGIAVYPEDGKDFDILLKKADTALYKAKEGGRNAYQFYTEQMNGEAIEYLKIRNGLRLALINEEFLLHYQPQINLADGKVVGVEALIRWRHPELGILQPARFISIAEDSGLIVPIGDWVLKHACMQAVEWRQAGLSPIVMAVNLSAVQFKRGDIEKSVLQALHESGHDPNYLELELTESILIHDTDRALETLRRLKAMGMKLSIDDFGTGYSSLSYLKRFNVDKLKIDQSFVRDMASNKNDAAIVRAIIQMARSLNLQVIAEGVEDERLVAMLHHQQCDEAQGYHFARPMAPANFVDYLSGLSGLGSLSGIDNFSSTEATR